jgi:hypothetical protein
MFRKKQENKEGFPGTGMRKGNGHLPFNDPRALEGYFNIQQFPNVLKEFVHPGKDARELLMRCIFKDERERNAAVLYLAKCEEFDLPIEKGVLANWLAATTAVRGLSRRELLMAATNIIAPSLYGVRQFGRRGRKGEEEQDGQ